VWKRAFDVVSAGLLLVLLAPILAMAGLAVYLETGRPILFVQTRAGRHGRPFTLYKLRTLYTDDRTGPLGERATRVGRVLRRCALDELPQLWNVLWGEMSLIGPRPEQVGLAENFDDDLALYHARHRVPPGITGWAQVHGRNAIPWHERVELDLCYVEHGSAWTDLRILLYTPVVLLTGTGVRGPGMQDPSAAEVRRQSSSAVPVRDRAEEG